MASQPESRIVTAIFEHLRNVPRSWWMKVHGGAFQAAGVPDIVGVLDGRFVAIEVKTATGKVSAIQALTMRRLAAAGAIVGVARSVEEALSLCTEGSTDADGQRAEPLPTMATGTKRQP